MHQENVAMVTSNWNPSDSERAIEIWQAYQKAHDVASQLGRTVGIDPVSRGVWFGDSARDVAAQMAAAGITTPPFCLRVGHDYYVRKGGRR
jgi:hypothetical protein